MRLNATVAIDRTSLIARYLREAASTGLRLSVPEAGQIIAEEAKTIVPVDTGNLRDHIHVEPVSQEDNRVVVAVTPADAAANEYGFDPAYARRIEYGFIGVDKLGRHFHQPAQPYMRPALDAKAEEATQTIKDGVIAQMDSAMSKVAVGRLR